MMLVLVAVGGATGAVVRYWVGRRFAAARFPWATLVVNIGGSLLMGVVAAGVDGRMRTVLGTGVAGALTTYSAFALDTVLLHRNGRQVRAMANVLANLVLAVAAFALGWWLGSAA